MWAGLKYHRNAVAAGAPGPGVAGELAALPIHRSCISRTASWRERKQRAGRREGDRTKKRERRRDRGLGKVEGMVEEEENVRMYGWGVFREGAPYKLRK